MDALTGAGIALVTFVLTSLLQIARDRLTEQRTIAAERRADQRALRDAKLARLRRAFEPVLVAAWGVRTASSQYIFTQGDPEVNASEIFNKAVVGVNEARAQLMLEGDVRDVFDELEEIRKAFSTVQWEARDRRTGAGVDAKLMIDAQERIRTGSEKIEQLVAAHLSRVEQSV